MIEKPPISAFRMASNRRPPSRDSSSGVFRSSDDDFLELTSIDEFEDPPQATLAHFEEDDEDDMRANYDMFCRWLQNTKNMRQCSPPDKRQIVGAEDLGMSSKFLNSDDEDEFLDTESDAISMPSPSSFVLEARLQISPSSSSIDAMDTSTVSETKTLLSVHNPNLSRGSSASDLTITNSSDGKASPSNLTKKSAGHNKGKAPPPPGPMPLTVPGLNIPEPVIDINEGQSLAPVDKERKKKTIFSYIPSMFKPISPEGSTQNLNAGNHDENHIETQI